MSDLIDVDQPWTAIAPQARVIWGVAGCIAIGVVALGGGGALLVLVDPLLAAAAVGAGAGAAAWWWWLVGRRYRAWGYAERPDDLVLRHGVLIRRVTVVPYGRMQLVDIRQGPLARWLGVASVRLHTAAAATDAEIPLVDLDEARRLRARLSELGEQRAAGL